jgi:hypothetical protein
MLPSESFAEKKNPQSEIPKIARVSQVGPGQGQGVPAAAANSLLCSVHPLARRLWVEQVTPCFVY